MKFLIIACLLMMPLASQAQYNKAYENYPISGFYLGMELEDARNKMAEVRSETTEEMSYKDWRDCRLCIVAITKYYSNASNKECISWMGLAKKYSKNENMYSSYKLEYRSKYLTIQLAFDATSKLYRIDYRRELNESNFNSIVVAIESKYKDLNKRAVSSDKSMSYYKEAFYSKEFSNEVVFQVALISKGEEDKGSLTMTIVDYKESSLGEEAFYVKHGPNLKKEIDKHLGIKEVKLF